MGLTGDTEADDDGVSDLLADLNPLRAAKYLDKMPATTQPTPTVYILRVKAVAAAGAASSYELRITDPGGEAKLVGQYKDLIFELDRAILAKLQRDMTKKQAAATPPPMPRGMPGGGFPGGLPGGFGE